jgi:hypothetical protein
MSKSEMRAIRREIINSVIHRNYFLRIHSKPVYTLSQIKEQVREFEFVNFGQELQAYA